MSRKHVKHLYATNFMGILDKIKKMRKNKRAVTTASKIK